MRGSALRKNALNVSRSREPSTANAPVNGLNACKRIETPCRSSSDRASTIVSKRDNMCDLSRLLNVQAEIPDNSVPATAKTVIHLRPKPFVRKRRAFAPFVGFVAGGSLSKFAFLVPWVGIGFCSFSPEQWWVAPQIRRLMPPNPP